MTGIIPEKRQRDERNWNMEIFEIHPSLRLYIIPIAIQFYSIPLLSSRCQNLWNIVKKKKKQRMKRSSSLFNVQSSERNFCLKPVGRSWKKYNLCVLLKQFIKHVPAPICVYFRVPPVSGGNEVSKELATFVTAVDRFPRYSRITRQRGNRATGRWNPFVSKRQLLRQGATVSSTRP